MAVATEQIHLRTLKKDKKLIARAARATGRRNLTDYILSAVLERAKVDLADRPRFTLDPTDFQRFLARLDEPPRFLPGLHALLNTPPIFEVPATAHGIQDGIALAHPSR
jgi:uncharacterized protein (DUF1778 family)